MIIWRNIDIIVLCFCNYCWALNYNNINNVILFRTPFFNTSMENTVFPFCIKVNYKVYIVSILHFVDNNRLLHVDLGINIENGNYEIPMERLRNWR